MGNIITPPQDLANAFNPIPVTVEDNRAAINRIQSDIDSGNMLGYNIFTGGSSEQYISYLDNTMLRALEGAIVKGQAGHSSLVSSDESTNQRNEVVPLRYDISYCIDFEVTQFDLNVSSQEGQIQLIYFTNPSTKVNTTIRFTSITRIGRYRGTFKMTRTGGSGNYTGANISLFAPNGGKATVRNVMIYEISAVPMPDDEIKLSFKKTAQEQINELLKSPSGGEVVITPVFPKPAEGVTLKSENLTIDISRVLKRQFAPTVERITGFGDDDPGSAGITGIAGDAGFFAGESILTWGLYTTQAIIMDIGPAEMYSAAADKNKYFMSFYSGNVNDATTDYGIGVHTFNADPTLCVILRGRKPFGEHIDLMPLSNTARTIQVVAVLRLSLGTTTNYCDIYVDGALVTSRNNTLTSLSSASFVTLGGSLDYTNATTISRLPVRYAFFFKTALPSEHITAERVSLLWNNGRPDKFAVPDDWGLQAMYRPENINTDTGDWRSSVLNSSGEYEYMAAFGAVGYSTEPLHLPSPAIPAKGDVWRNGLLRTDYSLSGSPDTYSSLNAVRQLGSLGYAAGFGVRFLMNGDLEKYEGYPIEVAVVNPLREKLVLEYHLTDEVAARLNVEDGHFTFTFDENDWLRFAIRLAGGDVLAEMNVVERCVPENPLYVRWINTIAGFDYHMFTRKKTLTTEVDDTLNVQLPVTYSEHDTQQRVNAKIIKRITTGEDALQRSDYEKLSGIATSPRIEAYNSEAGHWEVFLLDDMTLAWDDRSSIGSIEYEFIAPRMLTQF